MTDKNILYENYVFLIQAMYMPDQGIAMPLVHVLPSI